MKEDTSINYITCCKIVLMFYNGIVYETLRINKVKLTNKNKYYKQA